MSVKFLIDLFIQCQDFETYWRLLNRGTASLRRKELQMWLISLVCVALAHVSAHRSVCLSLFVTANTCLAYEWTAMRYPVSDCGESGLATRQPKLRKYMRCSLKKQNKTKQNKTTKTFTRLLMIFIMQIADKNHHDLNDLSWAEMWKTFLFEIFVATKPNIRERQIRIH